MSRSTARAAGAVLLSLAVCSIAPLAAITPAAPVVSVDARTADDECPRGVYAPERAPALAELQADLAWKEATGAGILVAIVDSGIDATNDHLQGVIAGGINLVPDGTDPQGLTDQDGHGTIIAGQIAARPIEGSGVIGLAPSAQLLSVRVFGTEGTETTPAVNPPTAERISAGIVWAAQNGADIINVSLSDVTEGVGLLDAVNVAIANGALVVASAGNRGTTGYTEDSIRYPAGFPGVLGVAATNALGVVTEDSIHGPQVAVAAPGVNVLSIQKDGGDCAFATEEASTSFATGYASAAAALVAEAHPTEGPLQWKYRLEASASRVNQDARDDKAGWGMVQPYDAITLVPSATTRGPESPFADTSKSAIGTPVVEVEPHPSDSPFLVTRDVLIYVAAAAASILGVIAVIIVLRRRRRESKNPQASTTDGPKRPHAPSTAAGSR